MPHLSPTLTPRTLHPPPWHTDERPASTCLTPPRQYQHTPPRDASKYTRLTGFGNAVVPDELSLACVWICNFNASSVSLDRVVVVVWCYSDLVMAEGKQGGRRREINERKRRSRQWLDKWQAAHKQRSDKGRHRRIRHGMGEGHGG